MSTLFVPLPLTVPALRTLDNTSGEKPTDGHGGAQTLLLANTHCRETMPNMMQRTAAYISTPRSVQQGSGHLPPVSSAYTAVD